MAPLSTPAGNSGDPTQAMFMMIMEAQGRLEKGQDEIKAELQRQNDRDAQLSEEIARLKVKQEYTEGSLGSVKSLLYKVAGGAAALGIGAGGSAHFV